MNDKTKAEWAKDLATGINGLIENATDVMDKCENHLGQDFGLYQVISLLRLANRDIAVVCFEEEIGVEADVSVMFDTPFQDAGRFREWMAERYKDILLNSLNATDRDKNQFRQDLKTLSRMTNIPTAQLHADLVQDAYSIE